MRTPIPKRSSRTPMIVSQAFTLMPRSPSIHRGIQPIQFGGLRSLSTPNTIRTYASAIERIQRVRGVIGI
jgi:hypothetical protein